MNNISIIGSGTMGNGIAHLFAQNDYKVSLIDVLPEALEKALITIGKNLDRQIKKEIITAEDKEKILANLSTYSDVQSGVENADLVVEAATENIDLKLKIFSDL